MEGILPFYKLAPEDSGELKGNIAVTSFEFGVEAFRSPFEEPAPWLGRRLLLAAWSPRGFE